MSPCGMDASLRGRVKRAARWLFCQALLAAERTAPRCNVVSLLYHRVLLAPPSTYSVSWVEQRELDEQIALLKQWGYYLATGREFCEFAEGKISLPVHSVHLTFDDGFEDNYHNAFPVLKKHNAPATIFLTTDLISRDVRIRFVSDGWGEAMPGEVANFECRFLSEAQIKEMHAWGVTFASHGRSHKSFCSISVPELQNELLTSQRYIANLLGEAPPFLSYPFGLYSREVVNVVKHCGVRCAFAVKASQNKVHRDDARFALPRVGIGTGMPRYMFRSRISSYGLWYDRSQTLWENVGGAAPGSRRKGSQ